MDQQIRSMFDGWLDINVSQAVGDLVKSLPASRGILLFADVSDQPIQLLSSASIRASALARLSPTQRAVHGRRADLSAVISRVYHLSTFCDFRSALRYRDVAMQLYPRQYRKMLNWGRCSFVKVDFGAAWPCFAVTQRPCLASESRSFGPFRSHKSAITFAEALNQGFNLCREPRLAAATRTARSCPYLQMDICPAPCAGRISRQHYMEFVQSALSAASGKREAAIEALRQRMEYLAGRHLFEQANQAKLSIQALQPLADQSYRWTTDLRKLAILHIDRSRRSRTQEGRRLVQCYAAFVVRAGRIDEFADFTLNDLPVVLAKARELLVETTATDEPLLTDSLLLLSSFLYRPKPPGIFLDCNRRIADDEAASLLTARFAAQNPGDTGTGRGR